MFHLLYDFKNTLMERNLAWSTLHDENMELNAYKQWPSVEWYISISWIWQKD